MERIYLSRDEVRELDRRAIEGFGVPGIVLMENAGRGCAELLMKLNPEKKPVVILCGPGNNGGDGFVIARHLDNHGWPVDVQVFARHSRTGGDAEVNFDILFPSQVPFTQYRPDYFEEQHRKTFLRHLVGHASSLSEPGQAGSLSYDPTGWVVDALFGYGLDRALGPPFDWLTDVANASGKPVLAVDIPSGLDCDSGEPLGPAIRATHTATFVALKKGFLNPASREWTGEVHVVDIGAPRVLVDEYRDRQRNRVD